MKRLPLFPKRLILKNVAYRFRLMDLLILKPQVSTDLPTQSQAVLDWGRHPPPTEAEGAPGNLGHRGVEWYPCFPWAAGSQGGESPGAGKHMFGFSPKHPWGSTSEGIRKSRTFLQQNPPLPGGKHPELSLLTSWLTFPIFLHYVIYFPASVSFSHHLSYLRYPSSHHHASEFRLSLKARQSVISSVECSLLPWVSFPCAGGAPGPSAAIARSLTENQNCLGEILPTRVWVLLVEYLVPWILGGV